MSTILVSTRSRYKLRGGRPGFKKLSRYIAETSITERVTKTCTTTGMVDAGRCTSADERSVGNDTVLTRRLMKYLEKRSTRDCRPYMEPPFLTFSTEILIEILAHLPLRDIVACRLTCRKLNDVIIHSSLLQYIAQTFLSGVRDPLILGPSIVERSDALQGLEATWRDLDIRQRTGQITRGTAWPWLNYIVHDDYLLAVRGDSDDQPPGYSYIDLRQPSALTDPLWRRVDVPWQGQNCMFAFAANENDLTAVVTCVPPSAVVVSKLTDWQLCTRRGDSKGRRPLLELRRRRTSCSGGRPQPRR